jgi:hypothetical protein
MRSRVNHGLAIQRMRFRIKAFAVHISVSACVLALALGALYLGWYQWPGWYVTDLFHVTGILVGVDLTLGPLFTLLIASPKKPRRELARDIGVIAAVQLAALIYGVLTLWGGRPLYYAYSSRELEAVAASELPVTEVQLARRQNPDFAPHWYSRPRWVWAPLAANATERDRLPRPAASEDIEDVSQMPRYYRPLEQAGDVLRADLKKVDNIVIFSRQEKGILKERMKRLGLPTDQADTLFMIGRNRPVLIVFDRATLRIRALIRPD